MKRLLIAIMVAILTIGLARKIVFADPPLPLPQMPICGDQDGSESPLVFRCTSFIPSTDVQIYQVPSTGLVDLRFDFVYRGATYKNELGFYKVENATGTVGGLSPGDPGYLTTALANATIIFPSGSTASTPDVTLRLNAGELLAFFIIQDNTLANFRTNNPNNELAKGPLAFFALNRLNPDSQFDHFIGYRNTSTNYTQFGFEDLTSGGDKDYDDIVYNITPPLEPLTGQVNLTPTYTVVDITQDATRRHILTAKVTDINGAPVVGAPVAFTVVGVNNNTVNFTTGTNGEVVLSYQSIGGGSDSIVATASIGGQAIASNRAFVDWLVDTDKDELYDLWETKGLDLNRDGVLEVDLPAMGADPNKKDIFVQVDWMEDTKRNQKPDRHAIATIVRSFAQAPDGGINLHVDIGPDSIDYVTGKLWGSLGRGHAIPYDNGGFLDVNKTIQNLFQDGKPRQSDRVFHYAFFVQEFIANGQSYQGTSGVSPAGIQVFVISLGSFGSNGAGSLREQAGAFMHELGHNLGLDHGGDNGVNFKPNYLSVMTRLLQLKK